MLHSKFEAFFLEPIDLVKFFIWEFRSRCICPFFYMNKNTCCVRVSQHSDLINWHLCASSLLILLIIFKTAQLHIVLLCRLKGNFKIVTEWFFAFFVAMFVHFVITMLVLWYFFDQFFGVQKNSDLRPDKCFFLNFALQSSLPS